MKKIIIGLIIGSLISWISVYVYSISANEISYSPSNSKFNTTNVKSSLDTLYDKSSLLYGQIDGTFVRNKWIGTYDITETSLNLGEGNYIVFLTFTQSKAVTSNQNDTPDFSSFSNNSFTSTGAVCENINDKCLRSTATTAVTDSSKNQLVICDLIKKCKVASSATLTLSTSRTPDPKSLYANTLNALKID